MSGGQAWGQALSPTSFPGFSPTRPTLRRAGTLRSVGRVGENPGNEVTLSPLDTYESYNSTTNVSGVFPTRQASKFLSPLNGSICPLDSSLRLVDYHFFHSYDSTTITRDLLQTRQEPKFPRGCPWEFLVGLCRPVLQILTRFQTKKCYSPHPFSDLAFRQKLCYHYSD